jgi:hypothetical protein
VSEGAGAARAKTGSKAFFFKEISKKLLFDLANASLVATKSREYNFFQKKKVFLRSGFYLG